MLLLLFIGSSFKGKAKELCIVFLLVHCEECSQEKNISSNQFPINSSSRKWNENVYGCFLDDNFIWKISLKHVEIGRKHEKTFSYLSFCIFTFWLSHVKIQKKKIWHLSKQHQHIFEFKKSPWIKGFPSLNLWDWYDFTWISWYINWHTIFLNCFH